MKRLLTSLLTLITLLTTSCERTNFPDELAGTTWDAFCLYTDGYFSYICLEFTDTEHFNAVFVDRSEATQQYDGTYRYNPSSHGVWLTFNGRSDVACKVVRKTFTYYDERGHIYELTRNKDL